MVPPDARIASGVLAGAAALALEQGNLDEAADLGERTLAAAREEGCVGELVLALNVLGAAAWRQDRYEQGRLRHEEALSLARSHADPEGQLDALSNLVLSSSLVGHAADVSRLAEEAVTVASSLGDPHAMARALVGQATVLSHMGLYEQAGGVMERALDLFRAVGDTGRIAEVLFLLGTTAMARRDYERSVTLLEECLALRTARGDRITVEAARGALGSALLNMGDLDAAEVLLEESYRSSRDQGGPMGEPIGLALLGHLALARSDVAAARSYLAPSASLFEAMGNRQYLLWCLEGLVSLCVLEERWEVGARLCGAREQLLDELSSHVAPLCPDAFDGAIESTRAALGDEGFRAGRIQGRALPLSRLMEEAIGSA